MTTTLGPQRVGVIHIEMRDVDSGELIESTFEGSPSAYLHGAGRMLPGIEAALVGKASGANVEFELSPADAFGESSGVEPVRVKRKDLPRGTDWQKGSAYRFDTPDGGEMVLWVSDVQGSWLWLSRDHPFAGRSLAVRVEVLDVRMATAEELSHGHAHGLGGHQH